VIGETADFVFYQGTECLALGKYIPEGIKKIDIPSLNLYSSCKGFKECDVPSKFWLFFDGNSFVLNDLDRANPPDRISR
jgi:hypothetical protein